MFRTCIWDRRAVYAALGLRPGSHLPASGGGVYAGRPIVILPPNQPTLHRVMVHCTCTRVVPFGRMPQHLRGKLHRDDAAQVFPRFGVFPTTTPQSQAIDDAFHAREAEFNARRDAAWAMPPRDAYEANGTTGREY